MCQNQNNLNEDDLNDPPPSPSLSFPPHRTSAPTSHSRTISPEASRRAHFTTTQLPSFPSTNASHHIPTGLAAMPAAKSQRAPCFSGQDDKILAEFLHEYEDLAVGNGLTEQQKVETILRYIPRSLRNLWVTLPGYRTARWRRFRSELDKLYPDIAACTRCTRQGLAKFVELSARSRICDENDIMIHEVLSELPHHCPSQAKTMTKTTQKSGSMRFSPSTSGSTHGTHTTQYDLKMQQKFFRPPRGE